MCVCMYLLTPLCEDCRTFRSNSLHPLWSSQDQASLARFDSSLLQVKNLQEACGAFSSVDSMSLWVCFWNLHLDTVIFE